MLGNKRLLIIHVLMILLKTVKKTEIEKNNVISFLMVGHIHEDIDSRFSKVADKLRRNDAETLDDLVALLPSVTVINYVYDVRTWIQDSICDLRKHTRPLHYKFRSNDAILETFFKGKYDSLGRNLREECWHGTTITKSNH